MPIIAIIKRLAVTRGKTGDFNRFIDISMEPSKKLSYSGLYFGLSLMQIRTTYFPQLAPFIIISIFYSAEIAGF